ncbi:MAG: DUF2480 family protein [Crocinitomicaceae bacterium]|nr:DUF2480 family protein [Crocinitomicaceae bacterium]
MAEEIVNKVAQAKIEQIDLASFLHREEILEIDLKDQLWNELVLKEKEFRAWVKEHDWTTYEDKVTCIYCSNEAIIPAWAFMLVTAQLTQAKQIICGHPDEAREDMFFENLNSWNVDHLKGQRVMVKGCSNIPNPNKAYVVLTEKLLPVVKSLMFGEPCSAVPVYKKK